jgi:hypothetical protein
VRIPVKIANILLALTLLSHGALAQERQRAKVLVVNVPDVNHADSGNAGATGIKELANVRTLRRNAILWAAGKPPTMRGRL